MDRNSQRGAGIAFFLLGIVFIATGNAAGWGFFILGIVWMSGTVGPLESWSDRNPEIARWVLGGLVVLSVLAAIGTILLKYR